jgi:hypothetical protein
MYRQSADSASDLLIECSMWKSSGDAKRDALVRFVRKLAQSSGTVSDEDFAAISHRTSRSERILRMS